MKNTNIILSLTGIMQKTMPLMAIAILTAAIVVTVQSVQAATHVAKLCAGNPHDAGKSGNPHDAGDKGNPHDTASIKPISRELDTCPGSK